MTVHSLPRPVEVAVYSRPGCQQCRVTAQQLDRLGIPYDYRDVTQDPLWADTVTALGYQSLPVVTAGDMHWSGFRAAKIKRLAEIHGIAVDISDLDAMAEEYLAGGAA